MVYENPKTVERAIKRLTRELADIDDFIYGTEKDKDRCLYMGALQQKREDLVRATVLHMHLAIEDLITARLWGEILGVPHRSPDGKRGKMRQALARMLAGGGSLGFEMKLNLALVVGVINSKTRNKLQELNTLRNKCSHNWLLNMPAKKPKKPKQQRLRLLNFRGRDLYKLSVLKDFLREYGLIYYKMVSIAFARDETLTK